MAGYPSLLFDTASLYFRAFYGIPTTLTARDGRPVNAVRGLLDFLARFITDYRPDRVACCWDNDWRPAWRVAFVPSYKAHRVAGAVAASLAESQPGDVETQASGSGAVGHAEPGAEEVPDLLAPQVPLIREVLDALGLAVVGADGYEADDVLATLAERLSGPTDVVTGDRDLFQVVDDARGVRVLYLSRGAGRHDRVTDAWLAERYGVVGSQYADYATLRGDPSDGLPGVRGIGEKTAASLLAAYGDLEGVLAHLEVLGPAVRRALASHVEYVRKASRVVTCARDVPLPDADLALPRTPRDPDRFAALADELRLGGAAERIVRAMAG